MKTFYRFCWFCVIVIALFVLAVFLGGCGSSKNKLTQKSQFSTEIAKVERVNELTENHIVESNKMVRKTETHSITENNDVSLTQADPDKEIILIQPNGDTTKIKGANAVISIRKETKKVTDTLQKNTTIADSYRNEKNSETDLKIDASGSERTTGVEIERGFPWWILILVVLAYGVLSYFKGMNPVNWF